jgi:hypothetical protein
MTANEFPLDRLVIPHGGFRTIVADPPWIYGKWGKASKPNYSGHIPDDDYRRNKGTTCGQRKSIFQTLLVFWSLGASDTARH